MARSIAAPGPNCWPNAARLGGCATGDARITRGYRLPARHVIHAVGPIWQGGDDREEDLLASCYRRAIELCQANALASVAFPAISTGVYRFPAERAAGIAVTAVADALDDAPGVTSVTFCCFSGVSGRLHEAALAELGGPCA